MDPQFYAKRPIAHKDNGPLFDQPPVESEGRKRARAEVTDSQIESDKERICRAIDEAGERGLTRSEIATATGIGKDTVNRRLGHDILPRPSKYCEPYMRGTEKVVVNAAIRAKYIGSSPDYRASQRERGGA